MKCWAGSWASWARCLLSRYCLVHDVMHTLPAVRIERTHREPQQLLATIVVIQCMQSLNIDAGKLTPDNVSEQIQIKTQAIVASPVVAKQGKPLNVILFGPPASGKGTQAAFLKKKYNLVHISTGRCLD